MIRIDWFWRDLLSKLESGASWRSVFVTGATDSGKSTLCRFLGEHLSKHHRTAAIDCDPGQCVLGPPTTLALGWEPWKAGSRVTLRFVGSTTPARHLLQTLTGMKRLAERAHEEGAEKIVFDSSGYATTDAGREFFFQTLDLLEPDYLVALQQSDEMEPLLSNFARRARPQLLRLPVSEAIEARDRERRRDYRQKKFEHYFRDALSQTVSLDAIGFHGMIPALNLSSSWLNRLVALCDERGFAAVLGILEQVELPRNRLFLYAPPFESDRIVSIHFGSLRLARSGEEL